MSGEFVARGAWVIHGTKHPLKDLPNELALGTIDYEGESLWTAAPPESLRRRGTIRFLLTPGPGTGTLGPGGGARPRTRDFPSAAPIASAGRWNIGAATVETAHLEGPEPIARLSPGPTPRPERDDTKRGPLYRRATAHLELSFPRNHQTHGPGESSLHDGDRDDRAGIPDGPERCDLLRQRGTNSMPVARVDSQNSKRFVGPRNSRPDLNVQMGGQLDPRPHRDFSVGNDPSDLNPSRFARFESVGPLTDPAPGGSLDPAASAFSNRVHPQDPVGSGAVAHLAVECGGEDPRSGAPWALRRVRLRIVHRAKTSMRSFEDSAAGSGWRRSVRLSGHAGELRRSDENPPAEFVARREIEERVRLVHVVGQEPASGGERRPCLPILERLGFTVARGRFPRG